MRTPSTRLVRLGWWGAPSACSAAGRSRLGAPTLAVPPASSCRSSCAPLLPAGLPPAAEPPLLAAVPLGPPGGEGACRSLATKTPGARVTRGPAPSGRPSSPARLRPTCARQLSALGWGGAGAPSVCADGFGTGAGAPTPGPRWGEPRGVKTSAFLGSVRTPGTWLVRPGWRGAPSACSAAGRPRLGAPTLAEPPASSRSPWRPRAFPWRRAKAILRLASSSCSLATSSACAASSALSSWTSAAWRRASSASSSHEYIEARAGSSRPFAQTPWSRNWRALARKRHSEQGDSPRATWPLSGSFEPSESPKPAYSSTNSSRSSSDMPGGSRPPWGSQRGTHTVRGELRLAVGVVLSAQTAAGRSASARSSSSRSSVGSAKAETRSGSQSMFTNTPLLVARPVRPFGRITLFPQPSDSSGMPTVGRLPCGEPKNLTTSFMTFTSSTTTVGFCWFCEVLKTLVSPKRF